MSDFNPGDGWRKVVGDPALHDERVTWHDGVRGHAPTYWIRDEAVSPLPSEIHTVIRVTYRDSGRIATLVRVQDKPGYEWRDVHTGLWAALPDYSEFEVLARPRAVGDGIREEERRATAKQVLDYVEQESLRIARDHKGLVYSPAAVDAARKVFG